jgi:hypothetical protein
MTRGALVTQLWLLKGRWCKELRARDGEMHADKRRAYVRATGRAGGRRGKPQRMSRRCPTRRFEICSQYLVTVTMPQPNGPCHSQHAYYCAIHLSTVPINPWYAHTRLWCGFPVALPPAKFGFSEGRRLRWIDTVVGIVDDQDERFPRDVAVLLGSR